MIENQDPIVSYSKMYVAKFLPEQLSNLSVEYL